MERTALMYLVIALPLEKVGAVEQKEKLLCKQNVHTDKTDTMEIIACYK